MITSAYKPKAGRFLVSEPFMGDSNFRRSVVLLVSHNDQGSVGFVLNRKLNHTFDELPLDLPIKDFPAPVYLGGPVEQGSLHYVHRLQVPLTDSHPVSEGIRFGGNFEELTTHIVEGAVSPEEVMFFVGYSGWGPGQLAAELEQKAWIVVPNDDELIFQDENSDLWKKALSSLGPKFKVISNYPADPRLN